MKKTLLSIVILLTMVTLSCKKQAEQNIDLDKPYEKEKIKIGASQQKEASFYKDSTKLFDATTIAAINNGCNHKLMPLFDEIDALLPNYPDAERVHFKITYNNQFAYITDFVVLDEDDKEVLNASDYDASSLPPIDWEGIRYGRNKAGWTSNGSCTSRDCIENKTSSILTANLDATGKTVTIEYARDASGVTIHSKVVTN
jgi:uncharacterized protein YxeA